MTDATSLTLEGFRACYDDALFFLTEVEGLPETDPVVVGLRRHLEDQWRQMCTELLLNELSHGDSAALHCKAPASAFDTVSETLFGDARALASDCGSRADAAAAAPLSAVSAALMSSPDLLAVAAELLGSYGCDREELESDDSTSDDDDWPSGGGEDDDDLASEP